MATYLPFDSFTRPHQLQQYDAFTRPHSLNPPTPTFAQTMPITTTVPVNQDTFKNLGNYFNWSSTKTQLPARTVAPAKVAPAKPVAPTIPMNTTPLQIGGNPNQSTAPTVFSELGIGQNPNQSLATTNLNQGYGYYDPLTYGINAKNPIKYDNPNVQAAADEWARQQTTGIRQVQPSGAGVEPTGGFFDNWSGRDFLDAGQLGLNAINTGAGLYFGLNQLDLAKDQFNFQKDAFNKNYAASAATTNNALYRQYAKGASMGGGNIMSQDEWQKKGGGVASR